MSVQESAPAAVLDRVELAPRRTAAAVATPAVPAASARDLRIDALRGLAMVLVVVTHTQLGSLLLYVTEERLGVVTGAELFVALSGFVMGMLYRRRVAAVGLRASALQLWRRSRTLYLATLGVVTAVWLARAAGVDTSVVSSWRDQPSGRVYDLYAHSGAADLAWGLLTLHLGPWPINIMGLYVALLAAAPLALWLLQRGLTPVLLALAWGAWLAFVHHPVRVLPSASETPFPTVLWSALFLTALAAGWHRDRLAQLLRMRAGRIAAAVAVATCLALALFSWNNPWVPVPWPVRLGAIGDERFTAIYRDLFLRTQLGIGRIVDTGALLFTLYLGLGATWRWAHRAVGWFLIPLGQATLYVFMVHVPLLIVLHAVIVRLPAGHPVVVATVAQLALLAVLWTMVRRRVLFSVIPR